MKKILVPTDFSEPSQLAYKFALDLAEAVEGEVFVLHLIEIPMLQETTFGIQPPPIEKRLMKPFEEKARAVFEKISTKYPSKVPVHFSAANKDLVHGILSFSSAKKIDLIVMSTYGASGLDAFFSGSTAEVLARHSPVPVLAIPEEASFRKIKNIVFPNTLALDQKELVRRLKEFQEACKAKLHILLVNTPSNFYSDAEAEQLLNKFVRHYKLENCTLNHRSNQNEASAITDFLSEIKGDMVAMGTHGRVGVVRFIKGSITESVATLIDKPVWTLSM